jgi:uncharacterized membrane protein YbaN (DUF454 family)
MTDGSNHRAGHPQPPEQARAVSVTHRASYFGRPLLLVIGWLMVGLGFIGIFVPVLPTVPFLLVALWAFSRTSQRFHDWLYNHPRMGPPLRDWREHGAIPVRAKILAVATMLVSFLWIAFGIAQDWLLPTVAAACLIPAAIFIVTRPNGPSG